MTAAPTSEIVPPPSSCVSLCLAAAMRAREGFLGTRDGAAQKAWLVAARHFADLTCPADDAAKVVLSGGASDVLQHLVDNRHLLTLTPAPTRPPAMALARIGEVATAARLVGLAWSAQPLTAVQRGLLLTWLRPAAWTAPVLFAEAALFLASP